MVTMMATLTAELVISSSRIHHQVLVHSSQYQTRKHLSLKLGALVSVHKLIQSLLGYLLLITHLSMNNTILMSSFSQIRAQ